MVQQAGKAAPAVVVAGTLAAGPQAHGIAALAQGAVAAASHAADAHPAAAAQARLLAARSAGHVASPARPATRTYAVRPGDTLSGIAGRFYGKPADWPWLYRVNRAEISNPNLIYPGEVLRVPHDPPASASSLAWAGGGGSYQPRHAAASQPTASRQPAAVTTTASHQGSSGAGLSGTLGCSGLEHLWESAGGSPAEAVTAASIAMAESGGYQYATGSAGERGYWQINPVNGALSTYNAYGNARSAVIMSDDGTNWSPWTTYMDGAYLGRC